MALPLELRINGRRSFDEFRKKGLFISGCDIALKIVGEKERRGFAFAIPKKVGNAVKRNRLRRVMSEFIRLESGLFPDNKHYLLIVRGREPREKAILAELRELAGGLR